MFENTEINYTVLSGPRHHERGNRLKSTESLREDEAKALEQKVDWVSPRLALRGETADGYGFLFGVMEMLPS